MKRFQQRSCVLLLASMLMIVATAATASIGPKWSDQQLTDFSDVILTGQVLEVRSGWDPNVDTIYTYVTVHVDEVLKGAIGSNRITIKQLGGVVDELGLAIADQPTFAAGEEVLLFLEVRPRDGTLYTSALWQGKWLIETTSGPRVAVRKDPGDGGIVERRDLAALTATVRGAGPDFDAASSFQIEPQEAVLAEPFVLISPTDPFRYFFSPPVDVQAGGQPGLAGGGFTQIAAAVGRWNAAGSSFQYAAGVGTIGPRCRSSFLGNSRITISFMDPCAEISDSGGILAIGGSYFNPSSGTVVNGVTFRTALEGFVVNNDSATALNFLTNSGCFTDIELHELGHVLGLGHSADNTAIMFASVSFATCSANPNGRSLGADDVAGAQFIYPSTGNPPGQPTVVSAVANAGILTVTWTSGGGGAPTGHRLDFYSGTALIASITVGAGTSVGIPIPAGVIGTFGVQVTAFNGAGSSPPSAVFNFTIGGGAPGQPTVTSAVASGGVLTVSWTSGPGASPTSHRLDFYSGAALVATVTAGAATSVGIPLPPGVQGTFGVIVTAFNGAIAGPPSALFTFTIGPACTPPASPVVSGGVVGGTASVSWPPVPGATSYIVSAGTVPGGTQFLAPTNIGNLTGVSASGVPAGFTAWVRVIAVNACGQQSAPTDFLVQ